MSVQSEITRIRNNISNAYSVVVSKGGSAGDPANSENLPASIVSIPVEAIGTDLEITFTAEYIPANEG